MLQLAKKTHAELQERSEELEDTSSEIFSVKQALAAVLQQQQEVQCLVQEHGALISRREADESLGGEQSAYTFQSFLEKIQRATLLVLAVLQLLSKRKRTGVNCSHKNPK